MQSCISSVESLIRDAFKKSAAIPESQVTHECDDFECDMVNESFGSKRWQNIPIKVVEENYASLPLLTPAAFKAYLPAYLITSLSHLKADNFGDPVLSFTVMQLVGDEADPQRQEWLEDMIKMFNESQKSAIIAFLECVMRYPEYAHGMRIKSGIKVWSALGLR